MLSERARMVGNAGGLIMRAVVPILAIALLAGCESAEKYKKPPTADSTAAPRAGTVAIKGSPAQMVVVRSLAQKMEAAKEQWNSGDESGAIATTDSLCRVAETVLDTIPLGQPVADFLLIYVTESYDRLTAWHKDRKDDKAVAVLTSRFDSLAARLQERRDSTAATKIP